jgi:uncharacterized protein
MNIVGRKAEVKALEKAMSSDRSEFIAVYGRRRIGKTFLIRELLGDRFAFYTSGLSEGNLNAQVLNFNSSLRGFGDHISYDFKEVSWMNAFNNLKKLISTKGGDIKIIFIDEIPWMDTPKSGFMMALEHFWNTWASARKDIKLIICGSSSWWIIDKILKNKKGLYNRVTQRIKLEPFTLGETQEYLISKGFDYNLYQITQLYMVFGGVPFYLSLCDREFSPAQNIDHLFFGTSATLVDEYQLLFASLFTGYENHMKVIETIASSKNGLKRGEISSKSKIKDGGNLSKIFDELVASGFLRKYFSPGYSKRNITFQVIDNFTMFYYHFGKKINPLDSSNWLDGVNSPQYYAWAGNAFELISLQHIAQIKNALGIKGVEVNSYGINHPEVQIDLLLDRKDNVVNIIEAKFSDDQYSISKDYAEKLRKKKTMVQQFFKPSKKVWLTMLTTFGLSSHKNAEMVHTVLTLESLFDTH